MKGLYEAWLRMAEGMNGLRYELLLDEFGSAYTVFEAARQDEIVPGRRINADLVKGLKAQACDEGLDRVILTLQKKNIRVYPISDAEYPELLRHIQDPPPVLFACGKGDIRELDRTIAIVGSRGCTEYGRLMAHRFGYQLAQRDVTVVSGLALGVDAAAHSGALAAENTVLPTVAVIAGGVDVPYPKENYRLYLQILDRGIVFSEMPPGTAVNPALIPQRNRIIAGLAKGTLVTQAKKKSGTWHTVNYAVENNRDIFAVPGMIDDPTCEGCNLMIKQGAFLTTEIDDIIGYYDGWEVKKSRKRMAARELPQGAEPIVEQLKQADMSADELAQSTGIPMNKLLSLLTNLTRRGIIERKSYMRYHYIKED